MNQQDDRNISLALSEAVLDALRELEASHKDRVTPHHRAEGPFERAWS